MCKFCNKRINWESKDGVKKHTISQTHATLKPLLVVLETSKRPLAHEVYTKLGMPKTKIQLWAEGIFDDEVNTALTALATSMRNKTRQRMQTVATKCMQKLDTLMEKDPARLFLYATSKLHGKKNLLTMDLSEVT